MADISFQELVFDDFSPELVHSAIPGAEMEHRILRGGNLFAHLRSGQCDRISIMSGRYNFSAHVAGEFPPNTWNFGVRSGFSDVINMNKYTALPLNLLAIWAPGCELEYITPSEEQWVVLRVPYSLLQRVYVEIYQRDLVLPRRGIEIRELEPQLHLGLRCELESLFQLLELHSGDGDAGSFGAALSERIARSLARALGSSTVKKLRRGLSPGGVVAIQRLQEHVMRWKRGLDDALTVGGIKDVDIRVLQKATQMAYGVTPQRWLKLVRLNSAYEDLRNGEPGSVLSVCQRLHFGNAGRFAAEYKELFGETPLQTLKR